MRNGLSHMGKKFGSTMKLLQSKPRLRLGLWAAGLLGLATACADESKPLNTFDSDGVGQGPKATEIEGLITPIFAIAGVVFVLVIGGAILLTLKNRVKPEDYDPEDLPVQTHGNFKLEIMLKILNRNRLFSFHNQSPARRYLVAQVRLTRGVCP